MIKKIKPGKMIMSVLIMTCMFSNFAYAAVRQNGTDVKFTKHLIDSNSMETIASGTKKTAGRTLNMMVTYMYDVDGKMRDDWTCTKWQIFKSGSSFSEVIKVKKGEYKGLPMDSKVSAKETITVKAKGNNDKLDAKISGYLFNFTKK